MNSNRRFLIFLSLSCIVSFLPFLFVCSEVYGSEGIPIITSVHKRPHTASRTVASRPDNRIRAIKNSSIKQRLSAPASVGRIHLKNLTARSAVIMDGASGQIIYAKAPDQPRQPASTIKILTGLIAMETLPNDAKVSVSRRAAGMPRSKIYLDQRKSYNADDLINAVLLASANDASVALAEKVAGSEKQFAQLMTDRAKELGASNTVCLTASGLTARGQQSTARDLAVIFSQAMKKEEFARRVGQIKTKTREGRTLRNHNKALWSITGAEGGKTGYTSAAKQTYVGQFRRNDETLLVAVMGSTTLWNDIDRLVDYGFAQKRQLTLAGGDKKVSSERIVLQPSLKKSGTTPEPASLQVLADINKIAKL